MASFPVDGHCRDGSVDVERLLRDTTGKAHGLGGCHRYQGSDCSCMGAPTDDQAGENALLYGVMMG